MLFVRDDFSFWKKVKFANVSVEPFLFADESGFSVMLVYGRFRVGDEIIPNLRVAADFESVEATAPANTAAAPVARDDEVVFGVFSCEIHRIDDDHIEIDAEHIFAVETEEVVLKGHQLAPDALESEFWKRVGVDRCVEASGVVGDTVELVGHGKMPL